MPLPVFLVVKKGRKMSWRSASGTPAPLSPTSIRVRPERIASIDSETSGVSPFIVAASAALRSRLITTCAIRSGSASIRWSGGLIRILSSTSAQWPSASNSRPSSAAKGSAAKRRRLIWGGRVIVR